MNFFNMSVSMLKNEYKMDEGDASKFAHIAFDSLYLDEMKTSEPNYDFFNQKISDSYNKFKQNFKKIKISGAILVKNQYQRIQKSIASLLPYVDELVVADTGSTDGTVEVLKKMAAKDSKIRILQYDWVENYALMRNKVLDKLKFNWVFFLDSDEIITPTISPLILKLDVSYLTILSKKTDVCLLVQDHNVETGGFTYPDRIFKRTKEIKYFGVVHEALRISNELHIVRIKSSISTTNYGTTLNEKNRFNKSKRYGTLLAEMIKREPWNDRWVSLLKYEYVEKGIVQTNYPKLLREHFLKDPEKPISDKNCKKNMFTVTILERYVAYLIIKNKFEDAQNLIKFCERTYPTDSNFYFYEYSIKSNQINNQILKTIKQLTFDINVFDKRISYRDSGQSLEPLKAELGRLLISFHQYDDGMKIINSLNSGLAKKITSNENDFWNKQ